VTGDAVEIVEPVEAAEPVPAKPEPALLFGWSAERWDLTREEYARDSSEGAFE